jgi:ABC-2 type transport system permease protein
MSAHRSDTASGAAGTVRTASGAGVPSSPAAARQRWAAQSAMELRLLLRNGENLLVTLGIPLVVLAFFGLVPVLPTGGAGRVAFLVPGVLTLSVMGSSLVSLGISTGFDRAYLVLKRLGATPLRRRELVLAKAAAVLAVQALQVLAVVGLGLLIGWSPSPGVSGIAVAAAAIVLGSVAFAGVGLALAGGLPAFATLAATNAAFLFLMLVSGIVFPLDRLPDGLQAAARIFPSTWLTEVLRGAFAGSLDGTGVGLAVLAAWAVGACAVAAATFRWE